MVQAWFMNNNDAEDQRGERHLSPPQFLSLAELKERSGVLHWEIDADNYENDKLYADICQKRGYTYNDLLVLSKDKVPDYETKLKTFFTEHLHSDEEIRFVLDGSGYFDVRDSSDKWIRIKVTKNDLVVLPAGIYHRFTLDHNDYVKVKRLFIGEPVWTAFNRPADEHPSRVQYLKSLSESTTNQQSTVVN